MRCVPTNKREPKKGARRSLLFLFLFPILINRFQKWEIAASLFYAAIIQRKLAIIRKDQFSECTCSFQDGSSVFPNSVILVLKQTPVLFIRYYVEINRNQSLFRYGNHIAEIDSTIFPAGNFSKIFRILHGLMFFFWRSKGRKIPHTLYFTHNPYIRPPLIFVLLHSCFIIAEICNICL